MTLAESKNRLESRRDPPKCVDTCKAKQIFSNNRIQKTQQVSINI